MIGLRLPSDEITRVLALRRSLRENGSPLTATSADLARFDLRRWNGLLFGIACVDSPIIMAPGHA